MLGIWWEKLSELGLIPSDRIYLEVAFLLAQRLRLNLRNPQTFQEKIQWLKLYNREERYSLLADKVLVKEFVASVLGSEYVIPTLGVWSNPEEIDFDSLPEKFVIKCNHNSGKGMYICKDKTKINKDVLKKRLKAGLTENYYIHNREWPYRDIKRKIIAEQFMEDPDMPDGLTDYKFFCFNGEPLYCQVIRDRYTKETIDFYDMNWRHQEFYGLNPVARNGLNPVARPPHLDKMVWMCRKLAEGIPFVRVDLYVINGKEYFGELTFFPASGFGTFTPEKYNLLLGNLLQLPTPTTA